MLLSICGGIQDNKKKEGVHDCVLSFACLLLCIFAEWDGWGHYLCSAVQNGCTITGKAMIIILSPTMCLKLFL